MGGVFSKSNLSDKAIVVVLLIILMALTIMAVSSTMHMHRWITAKQKHDVETMTRNFAYGCVSELASEDKTELERMANGYLLDPYTLFVAIYNEDGELIAHAKQDDVAWRAYISKQVGNNNFIIGREDVLVYPSQKGKKNLIQNCV